jgi:hypothetical protein
MRPTSTPGSRPTEAPKNRTEAPKSREAEEQERYHDEKQQQIEEAKEMIESGKKRSNCTAGWTRCANGDCKPQPGLCVGSSASDNDCKKVLADCQGTGQVMCNLFSGPKCVGAAACDPRKTSVIPACGVNEIRCQNGCVPGFR